MQECDVQAFRTFTGSFVNQADTFSFNFCESVCHSVFHSKCQMVHTAVTVVLFDEFGNGAFGRSGFEQLNFHVTYFQESGSYLLIFYGFNVVAF